jgi:hypothetical protein
MGSHPARERSAWRDLALCSLLVLLGLLAWDFSGLDFALMPTLGERRGFGWKDNGRLETVLHTEPPGSGPDAPPLTPSGRGHHNAP